MLPDRPDKAAQQVADIEQVSRQALVDVREAVTGYRRPRLNAECAGARVALTAAGVTAELPAEPGLDGVPEESESALAWALREAVTNVVRHSGARRCTVELVRRQTLDGPVLELTVEDDGSGGTDIEMPGATGIEAAARLHAELPAVKLVILTTFGRPGYLRSAMESGADAFLVKDAPAAQLAEAIRKVLTGERVIDPTLAAAALAEGANPLTDREREVLRAASDGSTNAELAAALHLSQGTVRNYLSTAIQKLAVRNRAEAVRVAREKGWLQERPVRGAGLCRYVAPPRERERPPHTGTRKTTRSRTARGQFNIALAARASPRTCSAAPSSTAETTSA